jgi:hypothetical protein
MGSNDRITELCTIDDMTYISMPNDMILPEQPTIIANTLQEVLLIDDLKSQIKKLSPHVRLINQRVQEKIRKKYTESDEFKMLRISPSDETTVYDTYVNECCAWGQTEKAKLGL